MKSLFLCGTYKMAVKLLFLFGQSEERELRTQAAKLAVLVCLRSWPGLVSLCQPNTAALKSLVALLYPNHEETRVGFCPKAIHASLRLKTF